MISLKENIINRISEAINYDFTKSLNLFSIEAIRVINERIEESVDVGGRRFKKYSKLYADFRKEKGRSNEVNLQFSGEMLNSIRYKVSGNRATIDFPSRRHKKSKQSNRKIAERVNDEREFFALSQSEFDETAEKTVIKLYKKVLDD